MQHPQYTETPINHLYGNLEAILLRIFARLNASSPDSGVILHADSS